MTLGSPLGAPYQTCALVRERTVGNQCKGKTYTLLGLKIILVVTAKPGKVSWDIGGKLASQSECCLPAGSIYLALIVSSSLSRQQRAL